MLPCLLDIFFFIILCFSLVIERKAYLLLISVGLPQVYVRNKYIVIDLILVDTLSKKWLYFYSSYTFLGVIF